MATYMEWFETLDLWSLHEHLLHALPRHCCHCPTWHHHGRCTAKLEASWVERKQLSAIRPSMQQLINVANPMVIPSGYDWQQPSKVLAMRLTTEIECQTWHTVASHYWWSFQKVPLFGASWDWKSPGEWSESLDWVQGKNGRNLQLNHWFCTCLSFATNKWVARKVLIL